MPFGWKHYVAAKRLNPPACLRDVTTKNAAMDKSRSVCSVLKIKIKNLVPIR
jgi:hypothetical protein